VREDRKILFFLFLSPQYVAIWIGLNKIGCVTALINSNLKEEALCHAIITAETVVVIVGADLIENYLLIEKDLKNVKQSLVFCEGAPEKNPTSLPSFDGVIAKMPKSKPIVADPLGYWDKLYYIYTSGTTGLPKPCIITTHRAYAYVIAHHYVIGLKHDDILLCTLPLYHRQVLSSFRHFFNQINVDFYFYLFLICLFTNLFFSNAW
jgi:acyl-coenzyme A synthetase/AMP-(fatty) acid ligase